MGDTSTENVGQSETITDIQNYLQSFNKEIGESGEHDTAFYAIDAQKLAEGIDDGTLQMLAEQAAAGDTSAAGASHHTATVPVSGDSSAFQTVAIVPDGESGGYVLIVQQPSTDDQPVVTTQQLVQETLSTKPIQSASRLGRIKQEKQESEKTNDISVYDFDDVNPPTAADENDTMEDGEAGEEGAPESDEMDADEQDSKFVTPKAQKRVKKSSSTIGKKAKIATPGNQGSSNQHMCNYCNYTSNKRYLLSRHMKSHSEERPHKCGICERGFKVNHILSFLIVTITNI